MCAGVDEQLSRVPEILGETPAPRPAMNEDVDRCVRALGLVDIKRFDQGRAVGVAPRRTQAGAHGLAVGSVALDDLWQIRRVLNLIIGGIQFGLVHVEPHGGSLRPWRLLRGHRLLGERGTACREYGARDASPKKRPASDGTANRQLSRIHGFLPFAIVQEVTPNYYSVREYTDQRSAPNAAARRRVASVTLSSSRAGRPVVLATYRVFARSARLCYPARHSRRVAACLRVGATRPAPRPGSGRRASAAGAWRGRSRSSTGDRVPGPPRTG